MEPLPPPPPTEPTFAVGDRVEFKYNPGLTGTIVEVRGRLGRGGAMIYRIRLPYKPKPLYVELSADNFDRL